METNLDIREVCSDNTIHDTPHVCNGILVAHLHTQLVPDKAAGTLTTEQVLGADRLGLRAIHVRQADLNRVIGILSIVLEPGNGPRPLDLSAVLLNVLDEDPLDEALVQERGEWVPRIDEAGATRPGARPVDSVGVGVPECDLVHLDRKSVV